MYPSPVKGASLLLAFKPVSRTVLIVGTQGLAASRAFSALEAEANVVVTSPFPLEHACEEIRWRVAHDEVRWSPYSQDETNLEFAKLLDTLPDIAFVCITDTLSGARNPRARSSAAALYDICRLRHILVNTADAPALCDFTFPSTHRFPSQNTGQASHLQIAITTNGRGCRLAGRIRRELVAKLHPGCGDAVSNVTRLREMAREAPSKEGSADAEDREDSISNTPLNTPVPQLSEKAEEDPIERNLRRMRWVNQVSEYWPMDRLSTLDDREMRKILEDAASATQTHTVLQVPPPGVCY